MKYIVWNVQQIYLGAFKTKFFRTNMKLFVYKIVATFTNVIPLQLTYDPIEG